MDNKIIGKLMHASLMILITVTVLHDTNGIVDKQCTQMAEISVPFKHSCASFLVFGQKGK